VVAVLPSREHLLQFVMHTALILYQTVSHEDWKKSITLAISKKRTVSSYLSVSLHWEEEVFVALNTALKLI
jgi:hypothetical protein